MTQFQIIKPKLILFGAEEVDLSKYLYSFNINKSLSQPVASMQLQFLPAIVSNLMMSENRFFLFLKDLLKPQSVIALKLQKWAFLGLIDHVCESKYQNNNSTNRSLIVNVSLLLPKLLLRDNVVNSPILSSSPIAKKELGDRAKFFELLRGTYLTISPEFKNNITPPLSRPKETPVTKEINVFLEGRPEQMIRYILDQAPCANIKFKYNNKAIDAKSMFNFNLLDKNGKKLFDFNFLKDDRIFGLGLSEFSGPLINWIMACIDKEFYEVYFDTTTGEDNLPYCSMTIRPKPFTVKGREGKLAKWPLWEELKIHEISSKQILYENIGVSDFELKNFFNVLFKNSTIFSAANQMGRLGFMYPVVNFESIKKYGLRDLTVTSTNINLLKAINEYNEAVSNNESFDLEGESSVLAFLKDRRDRIVDWFCFPFSESGQITIAGNENITIGDKLFYKDRIFKDMETSEEHKGVEYYITGLTHSFVFGGLFQTQLQLCRGIPNGYLLKWLNSNEDKLFKVDPAESAAKFIKSLWLPDDGFTKDLFDISEGAILK